MPYVLEAVAEFDRLEKQAQFWPYSVEHELEGFSPRDLALPILDAGCGSGVASRYLARVFSRTRVLGVDLAHGRIEQARKASEGIGNLEFRVEDLTKLNLEDASMGGAICRYVIEHVPQAAQGKVVGELHRCLKPGGTLRVIDFDGIVSNIYPQTPSTSAALKRLHESGPVDFDVGRKLPKLMQQAGFEEITWKVDAIALQGEDLKTEKELVADRFEQAREFLNVFLGSKAAAAKFTSEYLALLDEPQTVLFYNKFVVTGVRPATKLKLVSSKSSSPS